MNEHPNNPFNLGGRVAVVTGAASGIGRGSALLLAQAGAAIVAADIDASGLAETARQISDAGGDASFHKTDVSDREQVEALADQAFAKAGRIDIWVNAAGILIHKPIVDATPADVERMLAVNLTGIYWCCAAAARRMRTRNAGSIINLSSTGADAPVPGLSLYSLTKAAVNMLTKTAATEFGANGIRVNAIAPGFVDTPMVTYRMRDAAGEIDPAARAALLKSRAQGSPLGVIGTPQDIALTALYLASDAARIVTGQVIRVNAGVSMV